MGATLLRRARRLLPGRVGPVVAALLAAVVLASSWVLRLSGMLVEESQAARTAVTGESDVELVLEDDDADLPLFDDVLLRPGGTVTRCIDVESRTLADPDPLVLHLDATPSPLADHVELELAGGAEGADGACEGLPPLGTESGRLTELVDELGHDGPGWQVADPPPGVSTWWYRVSVTLDDDVPSALIGEAVEDLTLRWSTAAAGRRDSSLGQRAETFVLGVAEDAAAPLVLLVTGALLFLGVHRRIDDDDPKLRLAPVDRRVVEFTDRSAVSRLRAPRTSDRPPPPPPRSGPGTA